jgi:hypothetical protein
MEFAEDVDALSFAFVLCFSCHPGRTIACG